MPATARRSRPLLLIRRGGVIGLACWLAACGPASDGEDSSVVTPATPAPSNAVQPSPFSDVTQSAGLNFRHVSGARGEFRFPEIMGAGGALIDYDRDGDLDVYLVQSGDLMAADSAQQPGDVLYRNEWVPTGELRFVDVTAAAGLGDRGYGMGAAVGDIDADGWPDLYVTNVGANTLWRNTGEGGFVDASASVGNDVAGWSTSAAFVDYDGDGDDDLFVANYVYYSPAGEVSCRTQTGAPDYCAPSAYEPAPDVLLRNDGGRYTDVTRTAGIDRAYGNGLGVVVADFDGDTRPDLYVANDQTPNILWINAGDGGFSDQALMAGAAYNAAGAAEASMGVTAGDADGDGDEDLFMTHLNGESNTLYANDGHGNFTDASSRMGLAIGSLPFTGFGARFFDLENDGDLDLYIANGGVTVDTGRTAVGEHPFAQHDQLFLGQPGGGFTNASARVGAALGPPAVGRGALFGDLDNDGDTDIVVTNNDGPVTLLRNEVGANRSWVGLTLLDEAGRVSTGRVALFEGAMPTQWRRAGRDGSYLSSNDPRVLLAVPGDARTCSVGVVWPDGTRERYDELATHAWQSLRRGAGRAWKDDS
jgi:hypothetical protein